MHFKLFLKFDFQLLNFAFFAIIYKLKVKIMLLLKWLSKLLKKLEIKLGMEIYVDKKSFHLQTKLEILSQQKLSNKCFFCPFSFQILTQYLASSMFSSSRHHHIHLQHSSSELENVNMLMVGDVIFMYNKYMNRRLALWLGIKS